MDQESPLPSTAAGAREAQAEEEAAESRAEEDPGRPFPGPRATRDAERYSKVAVVGVFQ